MAENRARVTAADLMANDDLAAQWETRARERDSRATAAKADARGLLDELRRLGIRVDSIADLYNRDLAYDDAIPTLLRWLPRLGSIAAKESIVRALSLPTAPKGTAAVLLRELHSLRERRNAQGLKWAIGNALYEIRDPDVLPEMMQVVQDPEYGRAREMIVLALGRYTEATSVLIDLLDDPQIAGHAVSSLKELAPAQARSRLEAFADHPVAWIRSEARQALRDIPSE